MLQTIIAGDTLTFPNSVPDYPASDGWTLAHILRPLSGSADPITLSAVADGDDYETTIAATVTSGYEAGQFSVIAQVSNVGGERYTLDAVAISGGRLAHNIVTIRANPAEGEAYDSRSFARRALAAIEATMEGTASEAAKRFTIRDREVWKYDTEELIALRNYYRAEVLAEEAAARRAAGLSDGRTSYLRFNRP
jgi:hypothetical protein